MKVIKEVHELNHTTGLKKHQLRWLPDTDSIPA